VTHINHEVNRYVTSLIVQLSDTMNTSMRILLWSHMTAVLHSFLASKQRKLKLRLIFTPLHNLNFLR